MPKGKHRTERVYINGILYVHTPALLDALRPFGVQFHEAYLRHMANTGKLPSIFHRGRRLWNVAQVLDTLGIQQHHGTKHIDWEQPIKHECPI